MRGLSNRKLGTGGFSVSEQGEIRGDVRVEQVAENLKRAHG